MSDGVSWHLVLEPWDEMMAALEVAQNRATQYALRATGRALIRSAKAKAPVYSGSDPRAAAESGQLRKSIKNGRVIKQGGGTYQLSVMPAGSKKKGTHVHRTSGGELRGVPLYRRQMEEKYGFMKGGVNDGLAEAREIYESAYAKAFAKYAP